MFFLSEFTLNVIPRDATEFSIIITLCLSCKLACLPFSLRYNYVRRLEGKPFVNILKMIAYLLVKAVIYFSQPAYMKMYTRIAVDFSIAF